MVAGDGAASTAGHGKGRAHGARARLGVRAVLGAGGGCRGKAEAAGCGRGKAYTRGSSKGQGRGGEGSVYTAADGVAGEGGTGSEVRVPVHGRTRLPIATS